jgi:hypothetical protein
VGRSSKGADLERNISRQLSLWWSDGKADDWFWRASQSGGRATQRAKKGMRTLNSAGDLCAQCADGQKLLDLITFELKRGYPKVSIADVFEKKSGGFYDFIAQAEKSASLAGTPAFAVLHKRDRRDAVIYLSPLYGSYPIIDSLESFLNFTNREWLLGLWDTHYAEKTTR